VRAWTAVLAAVFLSGVVAVFRGAEYPAVSPRDSEVVPVVRPGPRVAAGTFPILSLWGAEKEFREGRHKEALSAFLGLAYNAPDDERRGFAWMRIGEILLAKGELQEALSAVDKAILSSRARYLVLYAIDLKFRVFQRMKWTSEARQLAAYLLEQHFVGADPPKLLLAMARADAAEGRTGRAVSLFGRAAASVTNPAEAAAIRSERDAVIDGLADIAAAREAAESEEDPAVKAHLFLALGRLAVRKGFVGMGAFALGKAARTGSPRAEEAADQLYRLEKIVASRPNIVGLMPLSGKLADLGFAVLSGAEVALARVRQKDRGNGTPVIRWVDTAGQPDRARKEFLSGADRNVIGFLGPLTGEEGRAVGASFGPRSPPVLYLGQKPIPEKPFLYAFGLSPIQEARAVLHYLARNGKSNVLLLHPENGYGHGFAEAVAAAAKESGVQVSRIVTYSPELTDFTAVIRKSAGDSAFSSHARLKEKGKAMKLRQDAVVIADRWDRVFLAASQLRFYNVYLPLAGFSGWNDEELIRKGGDAVAGSVFSVDYAEAVPGTAGEMFRAEYREAMRTLPSRFEAAGYDGALFLAEANALEGGKEGNAASEAIRARIPRLKTFRGVTGHFQIGPSGEMRRRVFLLRVELGNFVPVPEGP
jgi:branched-chain amino acid transport system substrate-binding protein